MRKETRKCATDGCRLRVRQNANGVWDEVCRACQEEIMERIRGAGVIKSLVSTTRRCRGRGRRTKAG